MGQATQLSNDYGDTIPTADVVLKSWYPGSVRINTDGPTLATGLLGWGTILGGHPGIWFPLFGFAGGFLPQPGSVAVAIVDYDAIVANGVTAGFGLANDTTAQFGYAPSTGVIATDVTTALTAARLKPFKTLERVGQLLPRWGNDAYLMILAKPRTAGATYRNIANTADQDMSFLGQYSGWRYGILRSSGDFTNSAADKLICGFQVAAGTNAGGYNPTTTTVNSMTVQLAGGGAPALPAETAGFSAITAKRFRFDAATTTGTLRNTCVGVHQNTSTVITPMSNLAAAPVANTDIGYIEEPALRLGNSTLNIGETDTTSTTRFLNIVGVRFLGSSNVISGVGSIRFANCEWLQTARPSALGSLNSSGFYSDETGASIGMGIGYRCETHMHITQTNKVVVNRSGSHDADTLDCASTITMSYGLGCVSPGVNIFGGTGNAPSSGSTVTFNVGNQNNATLRPYRLIGAGMTITSPIGVFVDGIEASGLSNQLVTLAGKGGSITLDHVSSLAGGNANYVLSVQSSVGVTALIGANAAAVGATAGLDVNMAEGVVASFANLAVTDYEDTLGNVVMSSTATKRIV